VYTFTNVPVVELMLNGRSLGEKRASDFADRIILWDVPNEPGRLEAIGKRDGVVAASADLRSAGTAVRLRLVPNRTVLDATGQDLAYVAVEAVDANGVVVPETHSLVRFEVSGQGSLAGVDNADLDSSEEFKSNHRDLRLGRALAIVQSARTSGNIRIKASADGMEPATVEIRVEAPAAPVPTLP
jgi:beta-galactosidase